MRSLTESLSELTDRCREVRLQRDDAATRAQLEAVAGSLDTRAVSLSAYAAAARTIRARDQPQLEARLVAAADTLGGLVPSGDEQPMEFMRATIELEKQFAELESVLKQGIESRRRDLNEQVSRTKLLAQNLRDSDDVVQACVTAANTIDGYFRGVPANVAGFEVVTDQVARVRTARGKLIKGLGEHAGGIEDFLNQVTSGNGFPLGDLTPELLSALVEHGLASGLRVKPA